MVLHLSGTSSSSLSVITLGCALPWGLWYSFPGPERPLENTTFNRQIWFTEFFTDWCLCTVSFVQQRVVVDYTVHLDLDITVNLPFCNFLLLSFQPGPFSLSFSSKLLVTFPLPLRIPSSETTLPCHLNPQRYWNYSFLNASTSLRCSWTSSWSLWAPAWRWSSFIFKSLSHLRPQRITVISAEARWLGQRVRRVLQKLVLLLIGGADASQPLSTNSGRRLHKND